jgi:hypothetical protein
LRWTYDDETEIGQEQPIKGAAQFARKQPFAGGAGADSVVPESGAAQTERPERKIPDCPLSVATRLRSRSMSMYFHCV